jgi:hypothetical protein
VPVLVLCYSTSMTDDSLDAVLAERLTRAAHAAQDLCDVLWEALHEELSDRSPSGPRAQRVAELSERVTDVSSTVAALASYATPGVPEHEPVTVAEPSTEPEPATMPEPAQTAASRAVAPVAEPGAVIVDERDESKARARPLPWDEPPSEEMRVTRRAVEESTLPGPPFREP